MRANFSIGVRTAVGLNYTPKNFGLLLYNAQFFQAVQIEPGVFLAVGKILVKSLRCFLKQKINGIKNKNG